MERDGDEQKQGIKERGANHESTNEATRVNAGTSTLSFSPDGRWPRKYPCMRPIG